nr:TonB-dependent receptor [uncultured Rhodoferax sp.]
MQKNARSGSPRFSPTPLVVGMALLWPMAFAVAQTAAPAETATAPQAGVLQAVTVTAERRAENVKDVPSSISTISGEKFDVLNTGGMDIRMLSGRVPSLNIESSFGRAFPRFYIRGYGNTDFRSNASQPVSLIYDDIVQENPILKGFPVFDVDRIEVLAGPQGTLFGRNTPAGVVKIDSVKPSKSTDGYFNASYGTYGTAALETAFNLPLSGEWNARISAQLQHRDNWVKNDKSPTTDLEGYDDRAIRVQAAYDGGGMFSALFNVHGRDLNGSARLFRANIIKKGTNDLVDNFDPAKLQTDGINKQNLSNTGASAKLKWSLADFNVYSITGYETVNAYSRGDIDGGYGAAFLPTGGGPGFIPFPSESAAGVRDHQQVTQEIRLESKGKGPLTWQGGVYLFQEKLGFDSYTYNTLGKNVQSGATLRSDQTNDTYAVFGGLTYAVSDSLKLRGGLRYTQDKKNLNTQPLPAGDPNPTNTANGLGSSSDNSQVSWDMGATYKLDKNTNLFGRVATGFRGASIQPAGPFGPLNQANPETTTSFEVGVKSDLFDKRARASVSLFHYDVKDQQLTAVGGSNNAVRLLNAKNSMGEGVEVNFDAYLTPNFLVTMSGSYNHTAIQDPTLAVGTCGGCTVLNPKNAAGLALIDGNPLPNAPKWIANVTARYGFPAANGGEYFIYTDWAYRSETSFFLYKSAEFTGPALLEGGLRLGYNWGNGKYEAAIFGRNITNQVRVTGGIDFNNLTGFINDPRTYGVQFKMTM